MPGTHLTDKLDQLLDDSSNALVFTLIMDRKKQPGYSDKPSRRLKVQTI